MKPCHITRVLTAPNQTRRPPDQAAVSALLRYTCQIRAFLLKRLD
jgi:hypothetical protein